MSTHIDDEGRFQSEKYPLLPPDQIILSFHGEAERRALLVFADHYPDREFAEAVKARVYALMGDDEFQAEVDRSAGLSLKAMTWLLEAAAQEGITIDDYYYMLGVRDGEMVVVRLNPKAKPSEPGGKYEATSLGSPGELDWHPDD